MPNANKQSAPANELDGPKTQIVNGVTLTQVPNHMVVETDFRFDLAPEDFRDRLNVAIIAGRTSVDIAREFQIKPANIRRRRAMMRRRGYLPESTIEAINARRAR